MKQRRTIKNTLLLPSILVLAGCVAGGMFFDHSAPSTISCKEEAPINLTVSVNAGDARSLDAQLHYRLSGSLDNSFLRVPMIKTKSKKKEAEFEYSIPAPGLDATGKYIEAFFEITGPHTEDHSFYLKDTMLEIAIK
ncbi:MAG: hypothetical protein JEZ10_06700 [Verrucomicrobia bacterium]|nr:hypothetical protein [Verrucomicrobiota bacterium]